MRNVYLVCYDVADDKRLRKTYKKMRGFGDLPRLLGLGRIHPPHHALARLLDVLGSQPCQLAERTQAGTNRGEEKVAEAWDRRT